MVGTILGVYHLAYSLVFIYYEFSYKKCILGNLSKKTKACKAA